MPLVARERLGDERVDVLELREGMVVGEIGSELSIPSSTLSHHLEKLKNEDLVRVRREGTFLWYSANSIF